jgi:hypothetical protein
MADGGIAGRVYCLLAGCCCLQWFEERGGWLSPDNNLKGITSV